MSGALERLGRFAARRPWVVIATWAAVCVVVVTSAAAFGRELDDPFEAPGLDSQRATELLTQAGSADMGLGADVVLTPRDPAETFVDATGCAGRRWTGSRPPWRRSRTCSGRATSCRPTAGSP